MVRLSRIRVGPHRPGGRSRGRDDYLAQVRAAAEALVAQRYVLAEDIPHILSGAAAP